MKTRDIKYTPGWGSTSSLIRYTQNVTELNPFDLANKIRTYIEFPDYKRVAKTIIFARAIDKISNMVASVPWVIDSKSSTTTEEDLEIIKKLKFSLENPNREEQSSFQSFIKAIVKDLLVFNVAVVERQKQIDIFKDSRQMFWLWVTDPTKIRVNQKWTFNLREIEPRYYYETDGKMIPLMDSEVFLIKNKESSWQLIEDSPVAIAYRHINTWLRLTEGQENIVSNPMRNFLISFEEGNEEQLAAFRQYWQTTVINNIIPPIIKGKVKIEKIASDTESELFLQFTNYLISLIALAFNLSKRDFNLVESANRASASIYEDVTFQEAVLPIARAIFSTLNTQVIEYFTGGKFELKFSETEPRKYENEVNISTRLYSNNLITKNEARKRLGYEPIPDGDVFVRGNYSSLQQSPPQIVSPQETTTSQQDIAEYKEKALQEILTRFQTSKQNDYNYCELCFCPSLSFETLERGLECLWLFLEQQL